MKAFGDQRISAGEKILVMDLESCSGMDSTFMGTLAGMSARLTTRGEGTLQVAEPGSRNLRSLEDLGLDNLMEINPPNAPWRGGLEEIRGRLRAPGAVAPMDMLQRKRHVLESHETLSDLSGKNAREFSNVADHLRKEISEKDPQSGDPQP